MDRMPSWLRQEIPGQASRTVSLQLERFGVDTVCRQARCPNINSCFKNGELTYMILGSSCTRSCRFCNVRHARPPDTDFSGEPERIARSAFALGLRYAVVTSVTRDDLPDGGSRQFARTIAALGAADIRIKTEVLIPDFQGSPASLRDVVCALPDVTAHNLETVRRLYPSIKPDSGYDVSLGVLRTIKKIQPGMLTKSSLLLGLGETEEDVAAALADLKEAGCDIVVMGQYLAPSAGHHPVEKFLRPEEFLRYGARARELGFRAVLSEPLARSSYRAHQLYLQALEN